jgi:hypothetical protein
MADAGAGLFLARVGHYARTGVADFYAATIASVVQEW